MSTPTWATVARRPHRPDEGGDVVRRAEVLLAAVCGVAGYVLASALVTVSVRATWWREARRQEPSTVGSFGLAERLASILDEAPPTEVVHECPPEGLSLTPCCGRTPFELSDDRMTIYRRLVTCRG